MRAHNPLWRHFWIIEEAIRRFCVCPIFARLIDRIAGLLFQVTGKLLTPLVQAFVLKTDVRKFFRRP